MMELAFNLNSKLSEVSEGFSQTAALIAVAVLAPFALGFMPGIANQLVVGTIVNFALAYCAIKVGGSMLKLAPLIVLPSIGAYLSGIVFGVQTSSLLYIIPAIWLANAAYVFLAREKKVVEASFAKASMLFAYATGLVLLGIVPAAFLIAMGPVQLATGLAGGFAAKRATA
ncbi:MAG: hypothetical protein WC408_02660 [Candidatus Micrarchaeia archaeon]|jgi:hypothetical protein